MKELNQYLNTQQVLPAPFYIYNVNGNSVFTLFDVDNELSGYSFHIHLMFKGKLYSYIVVLKLETTVEEIESLMLEGLEKFKFVLRSIDWWSL